jgi:hypothetical protein
MNLNVLTQQDAERMADRVKATAESSESIAKRGVDSKKEEPGLTQDDVYTRLLKYIPAPLIGLYLFGMNIGLSATEGDNEWNLAWFGFGLFAFLTPIYLYRRKIRRVLQIFASVAAFAAFAAASPGPFQLIRDWKVIGDWQEWYGSIALVVVLAILIALQPGDLPEDAIEQTVN